ncbi:penicillin acylase family protein [Parahaliea maris]|nr:penicillin acylase family protein [Parahaliea maris]
MTQLFRSLFIGVVLIALGLGLAAYLTLRASLPALDGTVEHAALERPSSLSRDGRGTAIITAETTADAMFTLGYAHAQDRFFQMDMLRRMPAGELSALFGERALEADRAMRLHRMRAVAQQALAQLPATGRQLLEAYTAGVNAGLGSLGSRPFEYWLVGQRPQPWMAEDSFLVSLAMMVDMTGKIVNREYARELLLRLGGEELLQFVQPRGSLWDSAIDGSRYPLPTVASPATLDLSQSALQVAGLAAGPTPMNGSNSWAVSGSLTSHGGALLSNDPHLGLNVPIIWYRTHLQYESSAGEALMLTGVSVPGLPSVAIGSNGRVAWSMTNTAGDWADYIAVELDGDNYLTPDGAEPLQTRTETIEVAGSDPVAMEIRSTRWGPLTTLDSGETVVYRWLTQYPEAINLMPMLGLDTAATATEAATIARQTGVTPFNYLAADSQGNLEWTVLGQIPERSGLETDRIIPWQEADASWQGWLAPQAYPRVNASSNPYIWTANNRVVGGDGQRKIGSSGYDLGTRAWLIEQDLKARQQFDEQAMLDMLQNDRAVVVQGWRDHLVELLESLPSLSEDEQQALVYLRDWRARAAEEDVGYSIARLYQKAFTAHFNGLLNAAMREKGLLPEAEKDLWLLNGHSEVAMIMLRDERPAHWLPAGQDSWAQLQRQLLVEVLEELQQDHGELADARWGEVNALHMKHPLAAALPAFLGERLNMPRSVQSGDVNVPLAQKNNHGQSMRFIVAPSREADGILALPGGQSGHPLSPFYRANHDDYVNNRRTPLLPGEPVHRLQLAPAG